MHSGLCEGCAQIGEKNPSLESIILSCHGLSVHKTQTDMDTNPPLTEIWLRAST